MYLWNFRNDDYGSAKSDDVTVPKSRYFEFLSGRAPYIFGLFRRPSADATRQAKNGLRAKLRSTTSRPFFGITGADFPKAVTRMNSSTSFQVGRKQHADEHGRTARIVIANAARP